MSVEMLHQTDDGRESQPAENVQYSIASIVKSFCFSMWIKVDSLRVGRSAGQDGTDDISTLCQVDCLIHSLTRNQNVDSVFEEGFVATWIYLQ